ncbi:hypothetical protein F070042J6_41070 [Bacteroides sp. f07]|uniref:hypothetical protein n=1 Tax=Bacteroides sp. f07 TaxID=3132704 RepID=UPI0034BAACCF
MKNYLFLAMAVVAMMFSSCKNDDDENKNLNQTVWINGYELGFHQGDKVLASITFLFFPENSGKEYVTGNNKVSVESEYAYGCLQEEETYKMLQENNQMKLDDGTIVNAIYKFKTSIISGKTLEVDVPVGRYFVVAYDDASEAKYRNKYTCKYYDVYSRYNPITLTVVMPGDLTQCGCIPWLNWEDNPYEF